jgi:small nuclear ribonucleoprotein (snRNP)-like protein
MGATALEQLDSEPQEAVPGAAKELFGSVPAGGSLSAEDDEFAPKGDLGPPVELASPEEFLRPLDQYDRDDADLPAPLNEAARTKPQPLAAWRPTAVGALQVRGEHRVAVHTRGGRTMRGTLRDIDLAKSQFPLIPQGANEPEAIYHSDVKAIFFMLAPGEKVHPADGAKVRVTFADGRVIEGTREGADAKHGFFLVPSDATRTNTRRIYVAREAISEIENG